MAKHLEGRVAVVTGAGRGIGRATALTLAGEGAKVVVNDLGAAIDGRGSDASPAQQVVNEVKQRGGTAVANHDSVATMDGAWRIIQTALDSFGHIDILVNNAGTMRDVGILEMKEEDWDSLIAVHMKGAFACTQAALRAMMPRRYGRIINISSRAVLGTTHFGDRMATGRSNYSAAKAGVLGFTRAVAREVDGSGVTVNAIWPTATTRLMLADFEKRKAQGIALSADAVKEHEPADVAVVIAYLATEQAGGVTGRTLWIDRGHIELYCDPSPVKGAQKDGHWTVDELLREVPKLLA